MSNHPILETEAADVLRNLRRILPDDPHTYAAVTPPAKLIRRAVALIERLTENDERNGKEVKSSEADRCSGNRTTNRGAGTNKTQT